MKIIRVISILVLALGIVAGAFLLVHALVHGSFWEVVGILILLGLIFEILLAILDISG